MVLTCSIEKKDLMQIITNYFSTLYIIKWFCPEYYGDTVRDYFPNVYYQRQVKHCLGIKCKWKCP
jgi:hypothetical protein